MRIFQNIAFLILLIISIWCCTVFSSPIDANSNIDYDNQFLPDQANNDGDELLLTSAGTGIIFRPLFVYRKQQAKKQKRKELVDNCIKYLQSINVSPPYSEHYQQCKLGNIL